MKTGQISRDLVASILVLSSLSSPTLAQVAPCLNYAINPRTGKQDCFDLPPQTASPSSLSPTKRSAPSSQAQPFSPSLPVPTTSRPIPQPLTVQPGALNQKIYYYALSNLGKQLGDGECATLTYQALKAAQAKNFHELGPTGQNADYVWGKLVAIVTPAQKKLSSVQVGDIVQFRDVSTYKKITKPDGSWQSWTDRYAHHTAIVAGISGHQILLFQQNVGNDPQRRKTVQTGRIDLDTLRAGTLWIYRPLPATQS